MGHRAETGLGNEGRARAGFLTQEEAGILNMRRKGRNLEAAPPFAPQYRKEAS